MIINPAKYVEKGLIKPRSTQHPLDEEQQVQQAGFDVRVLRIERIASQGGIFCNSKEISQMGAVPFHDKVWFLERGAYAVEMMEDTNLPVGFEGKLIHRSTLNRCGVLLTGSVFDPGYRGVIAGTLYVMGEPFRIEFGARIGQFQIQTAEHGEAYNGDYQDQQSHAEVAEKVNEQAKREG